MFGKCSIPPHSVQPQDDIGHLLAAAGRYPIPSKSEQLILGTAIQAGLQPDATSGQRRAGERARKRLVEGNLRLAISVAKPYAKRLQGGAMSFSDLIQESCMGLNIAALKFDPTRGYSFTTMATWWCKQAVGRAIQLQSATIRRPVHVQDLLRRWRYRPAQQTMAEFCDRWGYSAAQVQRELEQDARASTRSLDAATRGAGDGDGSTLLELIAAEGDQEAGLVAIDLEQAVARLRGACPDELAVVEELLVYGTVAQMARARGVTREAVANRLKVARSRLAAVAGPEALELVAA